MITKRSFVGTMFLMAASSLVIFASEFFVYADYRIFGTKANLFSIAEPDPQSAEEAHKQFKLQQNGSKILLKVSNGKELNSRAFVKREQERRAESKEGLPVIYVKRNADSVKFIESYDELNMPWIWLILTIAFSFINIFAWRLFANESAAA
jgi:hypothetical protein